MMDEWGPFKLRSNQIHRFYRGGQRIAEFRGEATADDQGPEDWVASTTCVFGQDGMGLSRLDRGVLLADRLAENPAAFFGPEHLAAFGADPKLLIKLLDAGERLPVHIHPDGHFAQTHLGTNHGKTEAWIILHAETGAQVHLGFSRDVDAEELATWVAAQEIDGMLAAMNRFSVSPGDSLFVPAGLPHAIGDGNLLLELQEPSDLSILLEWDGIVAEEEAYLGLDRKLALSAVDRSQLRSDELDRLILSRGSTLFPSEADRFFRAEWLKGEAGFDPSYSILVVSEGKGELRSERGRPLPLRRGETVLIPFEAGSCELAGSLRAIRCRPPLAREDGLTGAERS